MNVGHEEISKKLSGFSWKLSRHIVNGADQDSITREAENVFYILYQHCQSNNSKVKLNKIGKEYI